MNARSTTDTPKVSVILRTLNRPWYLAQALEGLANQTLRDFEALVINDGGEDVADLVAEFDGRVPCRYFHHQPGRGRCAAANRGLAEARGTFIAYLDDDDLFYPWHLSVLVEALEREEAHVAYTNAFEVSHTPTGDGTTYRETGRDMKLDYDFNRGRFFMHSYIHLVTLMHRRDCIEHAGLFDESLLVLEDLDLFFRLAQNYDFIHVRQTTAEYRIRDDATNAVTSMAEAFRDTRQQLYQKYVHLILPEIIKYTEHKDGLVADLIRRVEALEQKLGP